MLFWKQRLTKFTQLVCAGIGDCIQIMWTLRVDLGDVRSPILFKPDLGRGRILRPPLYTECQEVPRTDRMLSGEMSGLWQLQEGFRNPETVVAIAEVDSRRGRYFEFLQTVLWSLT